MAKSDPRASTRVEERLVSYQYPSFEISNSAIDRKKKDDSHTPQYPQTATSQNPHLGPGRYNPITPNMQPTKKNAGILLKSKVPRLRTENKKKLKYPGPEKYRISRRLLKNKKWDKKAPYSSFAQKVQHGVNRNIGWIDREKVRSSLELSEMRNSLGKKWPKVDEIKNGRLP